MTSMIAHNAGAEAARLDALEVGAITSPRRSNLFALTRRTNIIKALKRRAILVLTGADYTCLAAGCINYPSAGDDSGSSLSWVRTCPTATSPLQRSCLQIYSYIYHR